MSDQAIFFDPSRKRWWWIKRIGTMLGLVSVVIVTLFLLSVFTAPALPGFPGITEARRSLRRGILHLPHRGPKRLQFLQEKEKSGLFREISREKENRVRKAKQTKTLLLGGNDIVVAFYAPWEETPGLYSLRENASRITHFMPVWLRLNSTSDGLDLRDWDTSNGANPINKAVEKEARDNNLRILPVFSNAEQGVFDPARAHLLLSDPIRRRKTIADLHRFLKANRYDGVNIDFENLAPADYPLLVAFLQQVHADFAPDGLDVTADLEAAKPINYAAAAAACNFVVVMTYDEHATTTEAGPISSIRFFRDALEKATAQIPRNKLVIGLGNYALDWVSGTKEAEALSYQQALFLAQDNHQGEKVDEIVDFDPEFLNPTFTYEDEQGVEHEVWMLDAVTAANQWTLAQQYGIRGAAIWVLGSTDPTIWKFIGRGELSQPLKPSELREPQFPRGQPEFLGEGEILHVDATPQPGARTLEIDPATHLIVDEVYSKFPTSYIIKKSGYKDKEIALTIDDGPSTPYTSEMLDVLARYHVKATFFLIGENAERYPGLVRRIWADGHEIGNHSYTHPNIGAIPDTRAHFELNATQRVLQTLLGRSTLLFRPPYNADAEPTSGEEVKPVLLASQMNYITVGEFIDPQDWMTEERDEHGQIHKRTAEEMFALVMPQLESEHGNCILLHDGGGDRTQTIRLIPILIEELQKRGYKFVTVSQLLDSTRDKVNPPLKETDTFMMASDRIVFELIYLSELFLAFAFISGIILGTLRVIFVTVLAFIGRSREKRLTFDDSFAPTVSVVIAAYNEERVIARTIEAVLANEYPDLEIIVVDDGSKDDTSGAVARAFGDRVELVHQENAGKAAALNRGFALAHGEIIIALDADTIFAKDTIRKLVRRFADPIVGAVAGNVKVGNRINPLTYWQAIEYITSQNLDRRAYSVINAVTVVPGAVGAWRRAAILQASGYTTDTMAEDMDLTWRIRRIGWKVDTETQAFGYTEAPDSFRALFKQRFRWAFGTLQCLWKHRRAVGRYGWFGKVMLPSLWLFQVAYQAISPLVDLQIVWSVVQVIQAWAQSHTLKEWATFPRALEELYLVAFMYAFFFVIELIGSIVAFKLDREDGRMLVWLFWQRFLYRQLMYAVLLKSLKTALSGMRAGWGKLERKGTVELAVETPGSP